MTREDALLVYDQAGELGRQADALAQAREASDAYTAELGREEQAVRAARDDLQRLDVAHMPRPDRAAPAVAPRWVPPNLSAPAAPLPPTPPLPGRVLGLDRETFRTLVNRYKGRWQVVGLGRLNRLVDSRDHLLGEAVVLLPRAAFDTLPDEEADDYHVRLRAWADALTEYVEHLHAVVRERQGQAMAVGLDGVLELWLARDADGGRGWAAFIAARRASLHRELDNLREQIAARRHPTGGPA